ncbi:hypothetical protein CYG48_18505 (plasmid) [Neorhizobium sp. SOG26]|jgi:hypothetical protein|nr:hypothetical protein CYG48_18505 [Neorhizobium sp. SOG26]
MTTAARKQENAAFTGETHASFADYLECQGLSIREREAVFNDIALACNDALYPFRPKCQLDHACRRWCRTIRAM